MQYMPRSAWTSHPRGWSNTLKSSAVTEMAIHWPGTSVQYLPKSREQIATAIRGFESYHVFTRRWPGIGYCYLVDGAGRVWEGAGDYKAAHSATKLSPFKNATTIGVQLLLGPGEQPTAAQIQAVRDLYAEKQRKFPNLKRIIGHRDVLGASTTCPGDAAHRLVKSGAFYPSSKQVAPAPAKPAPAPAPAKTAPAASYEWPGAALRVDGDRGAITIRAWQRLLAGIGHYSGRIDGQWGAMSIRAEQAWLKKLGFYTGLIDGSEGRMTIRALQRFLAAKTLYKGLIDGVRGPMTVKAEQEYLNSQRRYFGK